jgi:Ras-related protein Rab-5C
MDVDKVRALRESNAAKVVLLGDAGAGKTSLLQQYQLRAFLPAPEPTVGVPYKTICVPTSRGAQQIRVWDTAGQERYRSLVPMYARSASAALIVVDTNAPDGAASAAQWARFVRQNCPAQCLGFLVANKIDLPRLLDWGEFTALARECALPIIQTTATQHPSVAKLFEEVAEEVARRARNLPDMDFVGGLAIQLPGVARRPCC